MISVIFGVVCLLASAVLLYRMVPREGKPPMDDTMESLVSLSQFGLMAFGLAFIVKGIL